MQFVARFDSRLGHGIWNIHSWYWEDGVESTPEILNTLEQVVSRFRRYLGADALELPRGLKQQTRAAFRTEFKATN